MSRRAKWLLGGGALVVAALLVLPFAIRWSRTCDEERERARATWTLYAAHVDGTSAEVHARGVLDALDRDLDLAVEHGDAISAAPDDEAGAALYREAMLRLSLAEGACADRRGE